MTNKFRDHPVSLDGPALSAFAIIPNDSADLAVPVRAITIGLAAGKVKYTHAKTQEVCITGTLTLGTYSIWASRVWATGTTATDLTGWE